MELEVPASAGTTDKGEVFGCFDFWRWRSVKLKNWCAFQAICALKPAPTLEFDLREFSETPFPFALRYRRVERATLNQSLMHTALR